MKETSPDRYQARAHEIALAVTVARTPHAEAIAEETMRLALTLVRKNRNYGNSVFTPPVLAQHIDPATAIRVRMSDKIARICSLLQRDKDVYTPPPNWFESVLDTFLDLAGYSILAVIALRESIKRTKPLPGFEDLDSEPVGVPASADVCSEDVSSELPFNMSHMAAWLERLQRGSTKARQAASHASHNDQTQSTSIAFVEGWAAAFEYIIETLVPPPVTCTNCGGTIKPGTTHAWEEGKKGACKILVERA